MDLLARPHHDGSPLHVTDPAPALGQEVTVFVRAPHRAGVRAVWLRTVVDGEPRHREAILDRQDVTDTWWRAAVPVRNPVASYRFLVDLGGRTAWLTAAGLVHHDVTDATDFRLLTFPPPPEWVADAVCYQVFLDRFAASGAALTWPSWARPAGWDDPVDGDGRSAVFQVFGGDLAGVEAHLDHVEALGANLLYLTPFFPAESSHRYNASTFAHVDPLLGGDEALVSLVRAAHRRGIRVVGDLTVNHTGSTHEWFRAALADPASPEASFYVFHDHPHGYESWLDVSTLPKLDLRSAELRRRLVDGPASVTARWLREPFALDGWRVDVANMAGRLGEVDVNAEVARAMRRTMAAVHPDAYLVAEHAHDASADLDGQGWHGTMSYAGFTGPVWQWLAHPHSTVRLFGTPVPVRPVPGADAVAGMRAFLAAVPWRVATAGWNLLGSHDTARFADVAGDRSRHVCGVGLLAAWPGVPMVFAGDEVGVRGATADAARVPMPWDERRWDHELLAAYRALLGQRRGSEALRRGGLRLAHVGDDDLVLLREAPTERVLVHLRRRTGGPVRLGLAGPALARYGADDLAPGPDGSLTLPAGGAGVAMWGLP